MQINSRLIACSITIFSSAAFATQLAGGAANAAAGLEKTACYDLNILLNPEMSSQEKQSHIRALESEALSGNSHARYMLGAFYRLGDKHPAKILNKNLGIARIYLSNAAVGGSYSAMAGMAELELESNNYRDAMLWAQVFAYFSKKDAKRHKNPTDFACQADLLNRIMAAAEEHKQPIVDQEFLVDFDNFFNRHGLAIETAHAGNLILEKTKSTFACGSRLLASVPSDLLEMKKMKPLYAIEEAKLLPGPGYAFYLLTINKDGDVEKAAVVDSLPDEKYGDALVGTAMKIKFNKSGADAMRQAFLPMTLDDASVTLKKRR